MKLILKKDRSVIWPVTISQSADGGGLQSVTVDVTFTIVDSGKIKKITADGHSLNGDADSALVCAVVKNIDGLGIESGEGGVIAFSTDLLPAICENVAVRSALVNGYYECVSGAVTKNV